MWDSQPLPAYQYFENVLNFIAAMEELKLPVFEASVFDRENLKEGSSKVVDCILALKAFHEWKQMTGGNGTYKPPRYPLITPGRILARTSGSVTFHISRKLDMSSSSSEKPLSANNEIQKFKDVVKAVAEHMVDSKENMDSNLLASFHSGNVDSEKLLTNIFSSCLEEHFQSKLPEVNTNQDTSNQVGQNKNMIIFIQHHFKWKHQGNKASTFHLGSSRSLFFVMHYIFFRFFFFF